MFRTLLVPNAMIFWASILGAIHLQGCDGFFNLGRKSQASSPEKNTERSLPGSGWCSTMYSESSFVLKASKNGIDFCQEYSGGSGTAVSEFSDPDATRINAFPMAQAGESSTTGSPFSYKNYGLVFSTSEFGSRPCGPNTTKEVLPGHCSWMIRSVEQGCEAASLWVEQRVFWKDLNIYFEHGAAKRELETKKALHDDAAAELTRLNTAYAKKTVEQNQLKETNPDSPDIARLQSEIDAISKSISTAKITEAETLESQKQKEMAFEQAKAGLQKAHAELKAACTRETLGVEEARWVEE
ncbi:MAG: hypothetical protein RIR26_1495 [Pseudomonadota bacterium]|jgi:hypothetical protein